jgi:hypothetical protein
MRMRNGSRFSSPVFAERATRPAGRRFRTGPPGFEPGFEAPEASVMSKLYYGPAMDGPNLPWAS